MASDSEKQAEQPVKKVKKPVDTVISVDHQNGTVVANTDRAEGETVKAVCNKQQRTATVNGGQLWFRFDSIPHLFEVAIG